MFLIDTNIYINASIGVEPDASFLTSAIGKRRANLSVITVAEFLSKASLIEQESFSKLIRDLPVLEIKLSTAELAGELRSRSRKINRNELLDCLLAAQAYENNLILVTNNIKDFQFKGIRVIKPEQA